MKNIILFCFAVTLCLFSACTPDSSTNPNQAVANTLSSGTWTTTARTKDGNNDMIPGDSWTFNPCSDPTSGTCSGTYAVPYLITTLTSAFTYRVYNNGAKVDLDFSSSSLVFQDVTGADILQHTATTIQITFINPSDSAVIVHTLTKQ